MPAGGTLTLRTGHQTVYRPFQDGLETITPGRYVVIEATDTGIGIPPEILPHIFEPFFTTRRTSGGSGLGLSTVLGIARQSGGFVTVDSRPNLGTTIRVYLPRHDGADTPEARAPVPSLPQILEPPPAPAAPTSRTVLLVEDEAPVRALAERALRQAGWAVLTADSAEAALDRLGAEPIDLLVSDIVLPGMDGTALLARLRARRPDLPAILVSGYAESAVRGDLPLDDVAFLPKPYALKALVAAAGATLLMDVPK
jgi:two-component system cell cycle sensor histidine kinase/response regulator CckA